MDITAKHSLPPPFESITLTSERLASPIAAQALTPERVRRYVRFVRINVVLPPYDVEARGRHETDNEKAANDAVFTDIVQKTFALLSLATGPVSGDGGGREGLDAATTEYRPKIKLNLESRCPSDREDWEARRYRYRIGDTKLKDIFEAHNENSYLDLRLLPGTSLPTLHCISSFHVDTGGREFLPNALCLMASRMLGLEKVKWELNDNKRRDATFRSKLRADFGTGLQTLPSSLQYFELWYYREAPLDHSFQRPSILNEQGQDELSLGLYTLSQRLVDFQVIVEVSPDIFGPSDFTERDNSDHSISPPSWPFMKRYTILPGFIAPSGKWRFVRDPDASDSDDDEDWDPDADDPDAAPGDEREHVFRTSPDPEEVTILLLALARAAGRMPMLREIHFSLDGPITNGGTPEVYYWPAGIKPAADPAARVAKLAVLSEPLFHPAEEVIQAWREAAKKHRGAESELTVVIRDGWYSDM